MKDKVSSKPENKSLSEVDQSSEYRYMDLDQVAKLHIIFLRVLYSEAIEIQKHKKQIELLSM